MHRFALGFNCSLVLAGLAGCRDEGPPVAPRIPVGIMWGSGASGAMVEDTVPLVVFYHDSAGDPIGWNDPVVSWSSSNPAVLQILSDSLALALDTGVVMLTGTTPTAPIDTIEMPFEVISRWQGRLVWDRSPAEGVNSSIALLTLPGHTLRQLPDLGYPGAGSGAPYLTSDGRYLAAIAPRLISSGSRRTIYVVDLVTEEKTAPFDSLPGTQFGPVWLPGDTVLAFLMDVAGFYEVFTARPDGSIRQQRTAFGQTRPPFFDVTPEGNLVIELHAGSTADLFETTLTGDTIRRLTTTPDDETSVSVSPAGTMIAFSAGPHVWVRDRDGSNPRRLLPSRRTLIGYTPDVFTAWSSSPSWTSDGQFVLVCWDLDSFVRPDGQAYEVLGEIYAIRVADGVAIRLTRSHTTDAAAFFR